jgi:hypothetical protein
MYGRFVKHPLPTSKAKKLILGIMDRGVLSFSSHAKIEMKNDKLDEADVRNTLRGGWCKFAEEGSLGWTYRFETYKQAAVIAFRSEMSAVVVTAFRLKKK